MKKLTCDLCDGTILEDYIRVKSKRKYPAEPFFYDNNGKEKFDFCPSCYKKIKKIVEEEKGCLIF